MSSAVVPYARNLIQVGEPRKCAVDTGHGRRTTGGERELSRMAPSPSAWRKVDERLGSVVKAMAPVNE